MNEQETIAHFTLATKYCLAKAGRLFPEISVSLAYTEIQFNIRGGGSLGQAVYKDKQATIRYNAAAATINPEGFADTVPHEVAHIVCFLLGTDRGHGASWRRTCRALGGDPARTCDMTSFPGLVRITRGTRYYRWEGKAGSRWVSKKDHTRLSKNDWCRKYFNLDTCIAEQVMSKEEWRKARIDDQVGERAAKAALAEARANQDTLTNQKAA